MRKETSAGAWFAIGMGIGTAVGVALGNLALGVGMGVAIGAGLAHSMHEGGNPHDGPPGEDQSEDWPDTNRLQ